MQLYPNPAENMLNISMDYNIGNAEMEIYNSIGELILRKNVDIDENFRYKLDINEYTSGTYFVRIHNSQIDITNKFVKKGK